MKTIWSTLALAAALGAAAAPASARELEEILKEKGVITEEEAQESKTTRAPKGTPLNIHWDNGVKFTSADGNFELALGGRLHNDWAWFDEDDEIREFFSETDEEGNVVEPDFGAGTEFRRIRLELGGEIYKYATFKVQVDFAGGETAAKDLYVGLIDVPALGELLIGHFKEPFSLEELTSSKYITFMERALPNVWVPSRNTGIGFRNAILGERATYAAGVFRDVDDFGFGFGEDDDYDFTTRFTGLPVWAQEGRQMVHLGLSYSHQTRDSAVRFRQRPEAHLSPVRFVDTGDIDASSVNLLAVEAATVLGPISVQGEYLPAFVSGAGDPTFTGYYVFVTYFLTGENRRYKPGEAAFDRVKPKRNFFDEKGMGGLGAWELAARWSALDLEDSGIDGGELGDFTFGINWYWNPNMHVMFNYIFADLDSVGEANIVQSRFAINF